MSDDRPLLAVMPGEMPAAPASAAEGWETVYRATVVLLYRFIYSRVGNRADAEDLTTQVYMRALPRLRLAAPVEEVRSYLIATARTVLADHWRDRYDVRVDELDESMALPAPVVASPADEEVGVRRAGNILSSLPDNYRRVLELRFLRGYSLRETAAEMGITVGNAKVMQHRALKRAALTPMEEEDA